MLQGTRQLLALFVLLILLVSIVFSRSIFESFFLTKQSWTIGLSVRTLRLQSTHAIDTLNGFLSLGNPGGTGLDFESLLQVSPPELDNYAREVEGFAIAIDRLASLLLPAVLEGILSVDALFMYSINPTFLRLLKLQKSTLPVHSDVFKGIVDTLHAHDVHEMSPLLPHLAKVLPMAENATEWSQKILAEHDNEYQSQLAELQAIPRWKRFLRISPTRTIERIVETMEHGRLSLLSVQGNATIVRDNIATIQNYIQLHLQNSTRINGNFGSGEVDVNLEFDLLKQAMEKLKKKLDTAKAILQLNADFFNGTTGTYSYPFVLQQPLGNTPTQQP